MAFSDSTLHLTGQHCYPHLTKEDLQAVFAFVHDCIKDEGYIMRSVIDEAAVH